MITVDDFIIRPVIRDGVEDGYVVERGGKRLKYVANILLALLEIIKAR